MPPNGEMMSRTFVVAMMMAVGLMAGLSRTHAIQRPSLAPQAAFEQQIEEGFGHLDQLPNH